MLLMQVHPMTEFFLLWHHLLPYVANRQSLFSTNSIKSFVARYRFTSRCSVYLLIERALYKKCIMFSVAQVRALARLPKLLAISSKSTCLPLAPARNSSEQFIWPKNSTDHPGFRRMFQSCQ
jgi:hypothetical protein